MEIEMEKKKMKSFAGDWSETFDFINILNKVGNERDLFSNEMFEKVESVSVSPASKSFNFFFFFSYFLHFWVI